ncbi:hypothetical protein H6G74_05200 [Nostoc spongiaeforme FACHB-130]|uniref:TrbI/VirB10 family protein n=1 Tax=Nostoc spongiaeforme FACHB-130 TaxID=1357510 RepID=A0ABR8FSA9_9NOSO|nr:TrbI/VirB10 family protein [Nostoc spongiaeforme]MBD2593726.1 hypothetical protein [Nostoc spongiaeforme FACHB-130]
MTSYSISSELNPQGLTNRSHSDSQKHVESSDWESKIARLVGFEDESKTVNVEATEEPDIPEALIEEPQEVKTTQPLSSNPFAKLTLVGSATLVVVLLAGGFLSQIMSGGGQKSATRPVSVPTPAATNTAPRQQDLQQQIEDLKTKLALSEQADEVAASQQSLRNPVRLVSSVDSRPNRTAIRNVRPAVQAPAQVVYVPRQVSPPLARPVVVSPAIPETRSVPDLQPQAVVTTPPAPPDPLQEWAKLAKLGSYGQVSTTGTSGVNISQVPPVDNNNRVTSPEVTPPETQPQPQTNPGLGTTQTQGPKTVAVGTSTKAVVATAIFGETTRTRGNARDDDDEDKNVFVIQLKQPLKSIDGQVAIPAKTELLAEIKSLSDQGLLQLNVTKIVSQKDGVLTETTLPKNAIIIRGVKGRPLIANKFPNASGSIASMDLGLFVLGGIGKAAELFNRTEAQVVTTTATGTIVSNTNPRRNILAGVLEGGFNSVIPQISQRNQQAIAQLTQQTNVWFIAAGKEVEVYVNQQLQF